MAHSQQLGQLDSDTLKDLQELKDTREEVLRSLGLEEGREIGLEEGKKRKALDIAQKLLATGMQPEQVAAVTELSLEEVQSLS
ncbi:MAG: hypothetical protein EP343_14785 [Deltaproteobacteria bacterium]|nr:MAG: hypothetical protein EP343_14785 [Deltaproteobacteria bacterium]